MCGVCMWACVRVDSNWAAKRERACEWAKKDPHDGITARTRIQACQGKYAMMPVDGVVEDHGEHGRQGSAPKNTLYVSVLQPPLLSLLPADLQRRVRLAHIHAAPFTRAAVLLLPGRRRRWLPLPCARACPSLFPTLLGVLPSSPHHHQPSPRDFCTLCIIWPSSAPPPFPPRPYPPTSQARHVQLTSPGRVRILKHGSRNIKRNDQIFLPSLFFSTPLLLSGHPCLDCQFPGALVHACRPSLAWPGRGLDSGSPGQARPWGWGLGVGCTGLLMSSGWVGGDSSWPRARLSKSRLGPSWRHLHYTSVRAH